MSNLSPPPLRDKHPVRKDQGEVSPVTGWMTFSPPFQRWLSKVHELLAPMATGGLLPWSSVSKTGSNLTDIVTRNHADLQNINTATYTHLTATNHTDLTDGGATTLHKHDHGGQDGLADDDHTQYVLVTNLEADRATIVTNWDDLTDAGVTTLHKHETTGIEYPASLEIGTPTHITNLQTILDHSWSAGIIDGCDLTDNGDGTISLSSGNACLRPSADPHSALYNVGFSQQLSIALTDNATNYVCLEYNAGSPAFFTSTTVTDFNGMDHIIAWVVHRDGTVLHSLDARNINVDNSRKAAHMFLDYARFIHASGGTALGNPSALTISVTSGHFYFMLNEISHDAFDTSVAGTANVNVFTLWNHVAGVYTETANQKSVGTTLYDDGTGTAALGNNKFGVTWFYLVNDAPSELHAVMGQAEYPNSASAAIATPPTSLPSLIDGLGVLIGFVSYEKSAAAFTDVKSAFTTQFGSTAAVLHNGLSGLQGGTTNEYFHLTNANYLLATNFNFRAFSAAQG